MDEKNMAIFKLPKKIQERLAKFPESGMGYQRATLIFSDKKIPNVVISNGEHFETNENIDISKLTKIVVQKNKHMKMFNNDKHN